MEKTPSDLGELDEGNNTPPISKEEVIRNAAESMRPYLLDFKGRPGYPKRMVESDYDKLQNDLYYMGKLDNGGDTGLTNSDRSADDEFAKIAEPVLTLILNDRKLFPTRKKSYAFLASEYDDIYNGTDIVFNIQDKGNDDILTFSIDVSTGTSQFYNAKKFEKTFDKHHGLSYIKYCEDDEYRWREPNAPCFILGMSPASVSRAIEKVRVQNGQLVGRETDLNSDFIVLSELLEQAKMQLAILGGNPNDGSPLDERIQKLTSLSKATTSALYRVLGIKDKSQKNSFNQLYETNMRSFSRFDDVYNNIVSEAIDRKNWKRGKLIV